MQLRRWQEEAIPLGLQSLQDGVRGVIQATTGSGKSVTVAETIRQWRASRPGDRVVVTTPTVNLVEQLGGTLRSILGNDAVGLFYTKKKQHDRPITVVCNPSVPMLVAATKGQRPDVWICDEMHRSESRKADYDSEDDAVEALNPVRRLGLTATPFLNNGKKISAFDRVI